MATNSNPKIQKLIDEVNGLDPRDSNLEAKLALIAQAMAAEQRRVKAPLAGTPINESRLIDPSDEFACGGCQ